MIQIQANNLFISQGYYDFLQGNIKPAGGGVSNIILATLRAMMSIRENKKLTIESSIDSIFECGEDFLVLANKTVEDDDILNGWEELKDVGVFLSTDKSTTRVFIDKENRRSIVASPRATSSIMAARIACVTPRLLPWMFDGGLTDLERRILNAINKDDSAAYNDAVQEIIDKLDIRTMKIKASLAGFELKGQEMKISNLERTVAERRRALDRIMANFNNENIALQDNLMVLSALKNHLSKEENKNDLMEFFLSAKSIELVSVDGLDITFVVKTCISQYDDDYFDDLVSNYDTILYRDQDYKNEDFEKLLRAIFETGEIKLRVWASFTLAGNGTLHKNHDCGNVSVDGYLAHPHLERFGCDGDNGRIIQQKLLENDYVGAVAQCIAATTNLNFYDSTVVGELMDEHLSGASGLKFLELPDGNVVTVNEAIKWIKEDK